jgi:hypothetical protein
MQTDCRNAIDLMTLPGGPKKFQDILIAAEAEGIGVIDQLAKLISLANASLVVADSGIDGVMTPWYRERAILLLHEAMKVLEAVEVARERRADSRLN